MITLLKNTSNTCIFTLKEKSDYPTYTTAKLFVVTNPSNGLQKFFTATNTSAYTDRYDEFTITESAGTENLLAGLIYLTGSTTQYNYEVYESLTPLDALSALTISHTTGKVLESGRLLVKGLETNNTINSIYL